MPNRHPKEHVEAARRRFPDNEDQQYGYMEGIRVSRLVEQALRKIITSLKEGDAQLYSAMREGEHALIELEQRRKITGREF